MYRRNAFRNLVLASVAAAPAYLVEGGTLPYLTNLVPQPVAVGNNAANNSLSLAAFGYDAQTDNIYVTSFSNEKSQLRLVTGLDGTNGPTFTPMVFNGEWLLWEHAGNPDYSGGTPVVGGISVNPLPFGVHAAYSTAIVVDAATTVSGGGTSQYSSTQRIYAYNLQASTGVASSVFTPIATLADFRAAAGVAASNTTTGNLSRQGAYSTDGQSYYVMDSGASTALGGLYRVDLNAPAGANPVTRLAVTNGDNNTEPAVLREGNKDAIYVRGGTANTGGIDKFLTDGSAAGTSRVSVLSAAALADFLEVPNAQIASFSMAADAEGNLYFNNTSTTGGLKIGIYRLDPQGRLSKVISQRERGIVFNFGTSSVSSNTLRMQVRETATVKQLLYAESTPVNAIGAVTLAEPGDFNLDGQVFAGSDVTGFKAALTLRGVTAADANLVYDMNGNGVVDWKDVKILQTFVDFPNGDADLNGVLDLSDLATLGANYLGTSDTWLQGDFTGDNLANLADLQLLAASWTLPAPTLAYLDNPAFSQTFRNDVIATFNVVVPEPTSALVLLLPALALARRSRRR